MHVWQRFRDQGVLVYGLHGDEDPKLLADFVEQAGLSFPVVHGNYTIQSFDFPTVGYPFPRQVVIDKRRVVREIRNDLDIPSLVALIEQLVAE